MTEPVTLTWGARRGVRVSVVESDHGPRVAIELVCDGERRVAIDMPAPVARELAATLATLVGAQGDGERPWGTFERPTDGEPARRSLRAPGAPGRPR